MSKMRPSFPWRATDVTFPTFSRLLLSWVSEMRLPFPRRENDFAFPMIGRLFRSQVSSRAAEMRRSFPWRATDVAFPTIDFWISSRTSDMQQWQQWFHTGGTSAANPTSKGSVGRYAGGRLALRRRRWALRGGCCARCALRGGLFNKPARCRTYLEKFSTNPPFTSFSGSFLGRKVLQPAGLRKPAPGNRCILRVCTDPRLETAATCGFAQTRVLKVLQPAGLLKRRSKSAAGSGFANINSLSRSL